MFRSTRAGGSSARRPEWPLAAVGLFLAAGCFRPPDLIIIDRKTALEQQAQGRFRHLDDELDKVALRPEPEPLTSGQLESASASVRSVSAEQEGKDLSASQLDDLLVRRCVGEAIDGTLVETAATCVGNIDVAKVSRSIERTNRNRFQVWRYLHGKRPSSTLDEVRRLWRENHLPQVVCGGQVQVRDGSWEPKKC